MIKDEDFIDYVGYDYYVSNDCEAYGCDSICRCSKIEDLHITSVDVINMTDYIYELYFNNSKSSKRDRRINNIIGNITDDINYYTIDRILRVNKVFDIDNWDINICNGYYGEEVEDAILIESVAVKIENQLGEAFNINELSRRIEYLLKLEYGYLLDTLKGKNYEFITIDKSDILFGSKSQYRKVKNMDLSYYKAYKSFRGIVIEQNNKYKLIDGYHRCLSSDGKIKVIKAV